MASYYFGYGVNLGKLKSEKLNWMNLLSIDEFYLNDYKEYLEDNEIEDENMEGVFFDWVSNLEIGGYSGLSALVANIINEKEGLDLKCDDYGYGTVYYPQVFPWEKSERMRNITKDELDAIFRKYIGLLTDEPINIEVVMMWEE